MGRYAIAVILSLAGCTQEVEEPKEADLDSACGGKCDSAELNDGFFEFIVVGSGAGGGPLASNLARAGHKVLLLEAGDLVERGSESNSTRADLLLPENAQLVSDVPAFHPVASENPGVAWSYFVNHYGDQAQAMRDTKYVPEEGGVLYPRGGTVGGSTAVNALITIYPHDSDWNHIASVTGDPSWRAEEMRRYFVRLERNGYLGLLSNRDGHGFDGWLSVEQPDTRLGLLDPQIKNTVSAAAFTIGDGVFSDLTNLLALANRDINAGSSGRDATEGVFTIPTATREGMRNGTRDYILETIERGYPLTLRTRALVTNVVFADEPDPDGRPRAVGVEYLSGGDLYRADADADASAPMGEKIRVTASHEVILSAGAFNTPQLLMLSGIGPEDELRAHGIDVRVHSPGVGRNLQDRYEVGVVIDSNSDLSLTRDCTFDLTSSDGCFRDWEDSEGVYTANGGVVGIVKRSSVATGDPDLFIFALGGEFRGYYPGYSLDTTASRSRLTWLVLKAHTENTAGTVRLRSSDPRDTPQIDFNYFAEGENQDLQAMVEGVQFVREIVTKTNDLLLSSEFGETWPGADVDTDEEIGQWVRDESWGHHASCTAPIGADGDPYAVLDARFRVRGVAGLRVVDASVFPRIPGFFPAVAVFMVSERATDMILEEIGQPLRQQFGNVTELAIPDDKNRDAVSEIVVPDGAPAITDLSVTVHVRHSYRGDLSLVLERDGIAPLTLVHRQGSFRNDINQTFTVPQLQGQNAAGAWRLRIKDHARGDAGTLTAWSIQWNG